MPTFTVIEYKREKPWSGKFGEMLDHIIDVRDEMGQTKEVALSQKATTPAPNVGDTLDLTLETTNWGIKAKRVQQAPQGGGFRPRDPAETAAIQRQHSQSVAVDYLRYRAMVEQVPAEWLTRDGLADLIDWFQRDIERGVSLAASDARTRQSYGQRKDITHTGESDVPSNGAPAHEPAPTEGIPF